MQSAILMAGKVVRRSRLASLDEHVFDEIIDMATWRRAPTFAGLGRTAWHPLSEPALLQRSTTVPVPLPSAKLKGVGLWNPWAQEPLRPPEACVYLPAQAATHFGIRDDGGFCTLRSEPTPIGGITLTRAFREFDNAARLVECAIPAIVPLAVVEYDLRFRGESLASSIALSPEAEPVRLLSMLHPSPRLDERELSFCAEVRDSEGIKGAHDSGTAALGTFERMTPQIGRLLRGFADAGLYRHSSGWENFHYCLSTREIFLTDLDSSRELAELPPALQPLQVLRDVASALSRLLDLMYAPIVLQRVSVSDLLDLDPPRRLLEAYFHDVPDRDVRTVSERIWDYFLPHALLMLRHLERFDDEWDWDRRQTYKLDIDVLCVLAVTLGWPLLAKSRLRPGFVMRRSELRARARAFLGDRAAVIERML